MTILRVALVLSTLLFSNVESKNLAYTIESSVTSGDACMTDCVDGKCWISSKQQGSCTPGWRKATTYYTSQYRYPSISKCLSKCVFDGYEYSWCYIDENSNWDYCSTDTNVITEWCQLSSNNGRCKDECKTQGGTNYLWCHTYRNSWDYCKDTLYYQEEGQTVYGEKCYDECSTHGGNYYWCYNENGKSKTCAPSAVRFECPKIRQRRSDSAPRRTISEYSQDIDNDPTLITVTQSTIFNPNYNSPVLDYTYRVTANGLRLPVRIRARIYPGHYQGPNSRTSSAISSAARTNCGRMGMNRNVPGNNDQCGHLVPYILGGPSDWFNIVPQTRRINKGIATCTNLGEPPFWVLTENTMRRWVQGGGIVDVVVLVTYNLNVTTRPTGFGLIERYLFTNGALCYECPGYWHSNDPNANPDAWNSP